MAIKKIEIRPKGTNNYRDILYPKTSADQVETADGFTVQNKINIFDNFKDDMNTRFGTLRTKDMSNQDLNDIKKTGFYSGTNLTNAPDNGAYFIEIITFYTGTNNCLQRLTKWDSGYKWERNLINGEWKSWVKTPNKDELDKKGDMHTNIYDKNQNGKVDIAEVAESVDWGNIKNKPDLSGKVTSVNGQTGAVTLYSSGIKYRYQSYDSIYDVIEGVKKDIKNIDLSADKVKVNNSNLNSKDVNSALTELFTFADNGKKNWVDVIGSPLSTGDSFSTLKSKTQTLKNTFASNLNNKKISASGTESLNSLINKIKNINVGKKFATGTRTSTMSPNLGTISDLNFRPSTVIWYGTLYESSRIYVDYMSVLMDGYISFNAWKSDNWSTHIDKKTVITTFSNGFSINPDFSYYNREITWRWYAFE